MTAKGRVKKEKKVLLYMKTDSESNLLSIGSNSTYESNNKYFCSHFKNITGRLFVLE